MKNADRMIRDHLSEMAHSIPSYSPSSKLIALNMRPLVPAVSEDLRPAKALLNSGCSGRNAGLGRPRAEEASLTAELCRR
jgi:hypothetical protein